MANKTIQIKIEAAFICLAVTDALGGPLEFQPRRNDPAEHVTQMLPNGNFRLPPGHFTDDTSMALCLAHSLIESNGVTDNLSQAEAYVSWFRNGWMSSVPGKCFDIGNQTRQTLTLWEAVLHNLQRDEQGDYKKPGKEGDNAKEALAQRTLTQIRQQFSGENKCGNGSLMRVLPAILVATSEKRAIRLARESSDLTHPHLRCADSCTLYAILVYRALQGASKQELFDSMYQYIISSYHDGKQISETENKNEDINIRIINSTKIDNDLHTRFQQYALLEDFDKKPSNQIRSSGYVLDTLEAALWVFFTTPTYESGAIKVVNLGDDADTVGAVYGGLAGAFYAGRNGDGLSKQTDSSTNGGNTTTVATANSVVPKEWLKAMKGLEIVRDIAAKISDRFHSEDV